METDKVIAEGWLGETFEEGPEYDEALWEKHMQAEGAFNAELGRFIRAFEFLMDQTREFIADRFREKGLSQRKLISALLLELTAGPLAGRILPIYNLCSPEDKLGFDAMKTFKLRMDGIIKNRNKIIHGAHYPINNSIGGSIAITKKMDEKKGIKIKSVALNTPALQNYVNYVIATGRTMFRVREDLRKGNDFIKTLKSYIRQTKRFESGIIPIT